LMRRSLIVVLSVFVTGGGCCLTVELPVGGVDAGSDAGDAGSDAGDGGEPSEDAGCPPERQCLGRCVCFPFFCGCAAGETICFADTDAGCSMPTGCINLATDPSNCGACGNVCEPGTACAASDLGTIECLPLP